MDTIVARISGLDKDIGQLRKEIKEKEEKLEAPGYSDNTKKFDFFAKRVDQLNAILQSLLLERSELTRQQGLLLEETDGEKLLDLGHSFIFDLFKSPFPNN